MIQILLSEDVQKTKRGCTEDVHINLIEFSVNFYGCLEDVYGIFREVK